MARLGPGVACVGSSGGRPLDGVWGGQGHLIYVVHGDCHLPTLAVPGLRLTKTRNLGVFPA